MDRLAILKCHFPEAVANVLFQASSGLNSIRWAQCWKALVADKATVIAAVQRAFDLGDGSENCAIESAPALTVQDSQRSTTELLQQKYGRSG